MNINETLYNGCRTYFWNYGCDDDEISNFLFANTTRENKQDKALKIICNIIKRHNKGPLLEFLTCLAEIEYGIKELQPRLRDHVVHAVMTYLLGIYLNETMMQNINSKVDPFQWKIACLFHDIAYPVEIAHNLSRSYFEMVNIIGETYYEPLPSIKFKSMPSNINRLKKYKIRTSFYAINKYLKKWQIKIDSRKIYDKTINDGNICHGMLSALTILFLIDKMYQQNNPQRICKYVEGVDHSSWDETYFNQDIVPACAAIFVHNIDKKYFIDNRIDPQKAPIAFLLRLCDSLQEWERPSNKKPEGEPPDKFDISLDNDNHLIYRARLSQEHRENIEENIKSTLAGMNYFKIHDE